MPKRKKSSRKGSGWHGDSEGHRRAALKRYRIRIEISKPRSINPPQIQVRKKLRRKKKAGPVEVNEVYGGIRGNGGLHVGIHGGTKNTKADVDVDQLGKLNIKNFEVKKKKKKRGIQNTEE